jgi:hypothetical protein
MQVVVARRWLLEIDVAVRPICANTLNAFRARQRFSEPRIARCYMDAERRWELDKLAARALGDSYSAYGYPDDTPR